jgi:thiamine monophosphate kinase
MAGITLAIATAQLQLYLSAEAAVLARQEYRIGDRLMKFADLSEVRAGVELWNQRVQQLSSTASSGRGRSFTPTPRW